MKRLCYAIIIPLLASSSLTYAATTAKSGAAANNNSTELASARRVQAENQPNRWIRLCKQGQQCPSSDEFKRKSTFRA